jgi:FMN-dependent NADH-azoreductase
MANVLLVTSSPRGGASYSSRIAEKVVTELREHDPDALVMVRDLAQAPLPHIDEDFVTATRGPRGPQTPRQQAALALSDELVDELAAADIVVIAAPMINFSVSSTLKAWFDYVARAGRTFRYSEKGPQGLMTGKRVIIVSASGGIYSGENAAFDFQVPWLRGMLSFLGMTEVEVIRVEGTALGADAAEEAVAQARRGRTKSLPCWRPETGYRSVA